MKKARHRHWCSILTMTVMCGRMAGSAWNCSTKPPVRKPPYPTNYSIRCQATKDSGILRFRKHWRRENISLRRLLTTAMQRRLKLLNWILAMKISLLVWGAALGLLVCGHLAQAQLRFNVYSGGYFNVTDYGGYTTPDGGHRFHIQYQGMHIDEPNWAIRARINGPIRPVSGQSVSGLPFPSEK